MIESLYWLVEPFERFAIDTVGVWYLGTMVVLFSLAYAVKALGAEMDGPFGDDDTLTEKLFVVSVIAPIFEESIFRVGPVLLLGLGMPGVVVCSVVWALLHGKRWFFILLMVPLYVKLTLGGFLIELFVVHAFHNAWIAVLSHVSVE